MHGSTGGGWPAPQGWPGGLVGQAGHGLLCRILQGRDSLWSGEILSGDMECVNVSPGGFTEPQGWVMLIMVQCGCRPRRVVARQDLFEKVGRRRLSNCLWPDNAVRVAVPNDL